MNYYYKEEQENMGKNVYSRSGTNVQQVDNCCTASTGCVTPPVYSPEDIISECIFTEKVYDSALIREEADQSKVVCFPTSIPAGSEIINATISCSVKPNGGSQGVTLEPRIKSINGQCIPFPPTPIVPGPGGLEQIPLDFIDTSQCDAEGRGTPIIVENEIEVFGEVLVTISGKARLPNGCKQEFTVKEVVEVDEFMLKRFIRLCMPSTFAAQKPSLAEFCAVLCDAVLPLGLDSLEFVEECEPNGNECNGSYRSTQVNGPFLRANLLLLFCIICEKKIKVPVQLCVLSTGFCQPEEQQGGRCIEFPRLFPEQVNVEIIGNGNGNGNCNEDDD